MQLIDEARGSLVLPLLLLLLCCGNKGHKIANGLLIFQLPSGET